MEDHRITPTYSEAFKVFLSHTDEKPRLLDALSRRLRVCGASSLLDIGAGNGDLSIPLARLVHKYLAIEQKEDFTKHLREAGLNVIASPFPTDIREQFDAVLLSHSLPSHSKGRAAWEPFLAAAWSRVNEKGHLLVVTFDEDDGSEWNSLINELEFRNTKPHESRLETVRKYLNTLGIVEQENITTHVRTKTLDEIMNALAFVWSDGKASRSEAFLKDQNIIKKMQTKYKSSEGYFFPFQHFLLDVHRP